MSTIGLGREQLENALDKGVLEACVNRTQDRWWKVRRNGATRTWKRSPERFYIPVKAGLKTYGAIEPGTLHLFRIRGDKL
jgi:hypothetical protein